MMISYSRFFVFIYVVTRLFICVSCDEIACYWGMSAAGIRTIGDCSLEQWRYRTDSFGVRYFKSKPCLRSFSNILKDLLNFLKLCLVNICDSFPIRIVFSLLTLFAISLLLPIILHPITLLLLSLRVFYTINNYAIIFINALANIIKIVSAPLNQKRWKFLLCKILLIVVAIFSIVNMLLVLASQK